MSYVPRVQATAPAEHPDQARREHVRSHLVAAVACAVLFFAPLGVAAVVCAGNVRTRLALGDVEGARRASRTAKWLCCASVAATLAFLLVVLVGSYTYSDVH